MVQLSWLLWFLTPVPVPRCPLPKVSPPRRADVSTFSPAFTLWLAGKTLKHQTFGLAPKSAPPPLNVKETKKWKKNKKKKIWSQMVLLVLKIS